MSSLADMVPAEAPLQSSVDAEAERRAEWFALRRGKFTGSRFGDLIGTGRGKDAEFSQTGLTYIYQVAAERLGSYKFEFDSSATRWGKDHEVEAIQAYCDAGHANRDDIKTGEAAFTELCEYAACTPDGLVGLDGTLEVKCPYTPEEHMRYLYEDRIPPKYQWQVLGHILVTGAQWCDFVSFDPRIDGPKRLFVKRAMRDRYEKELATLQERIDMAEAEVQKILGVGE
jgi:hypothetical protein